MEFQLFSELFSRKYSKKCHFLLKNKKKDSKNAEFCWILRKSIKIPLFEESKTC